MYKGLGSLSGQIRVGCLDPPPYEGAGLPSPGQERWGGGWERSQHERDFVIFNIPG